jgi:hypothetical protein
LSNFFKRRHETDLEAELRRSRPQPRPELVAMIADRVRGERRRSTRPGLRVAFAGALSAILLIALASVGGLGYAANAVHSAATAVTRIVTPQKPTTVNVSAAADQYGKKVQICAVTPNGKQHTISISQNAEASYLAHHPNAYPGSCGAFRPAGAKANVCIRMKGKFVPVFVPASKVKGYLHRNSRSHRTTTGKC